MTVLGEVRHRPHSFHMPKGSIDTTDNASVEELQEKLRALQTDIQQLRQAAYEAGRKTMELQKKLDASEHSARPTASN